MAKKPGDIHIYLPEKQAEEFRRYAESQHRSITNMLVVTMLEHMKRYPMERTRRAKEAPQEGSGV